jgi:glycosyltransferase involved in cell wall biosynthesis
MNLVVISHKQCWKSPDSPVGWATDGGFAIQMDYLGSLFDNTYIIVPEVIRETQGEVFFTNKNINIIPLSKTMGKGIFRKILFPLWFVLNFSKFHKTIGKADAIHAPIPGDVGTAGILLAHLYKKPLYVRHCGNWFVQKSLAEKIWKWYMEKYAGNNRVFLATGGDIKVPSIKNENIDWIFSTSMSINEFDTTKKERSRLAQKLKICSVSRQEKGKGIHKVIHAVRLLVNKGIDIQYDIVGEGSDLEYFKKLSLELNLSKNVTFHGKLNHIGVINILKKNDIFVFPTESEGFPKVVVEAMSQGLVIITTPVSVLRTMIPESKSGILLDIIEPEEIYRQLLLLIENPARIIEMGENAKKFAKRFTLESWANTIAYKLEKAWQVKLNKFQY